MTKNKYPLLLLSGGIAILTLLFRLISNIPVWADILIDIFTMLGSGVFCSALVSILIEKQNKALEESRKAEQREYIFLSAKDRLKRIYSRELYLLSLFYAKFVLKEEIKLVQKELTTKELSEKLTYVIGKLIALKESESGTANMLTIDADYINRAEHEYDFLVTRNQGFYATAHQSLTEILNNFNIYYASGIISENDKNDLAIIDGEIEDIITFSTQQELDDCSLLEFKKSFFENMESSLLSLGVSSKDLIKCNYIDVFEA